MTQPNLPPFQDFLQVVQSSPKVLADTLSLLFEPSPILLNELAPQLTLLVDDSDGIQDRLGSYAGLVDEALKIVHAWEWGKKSEFVGGHPRIGEVKGLSAMSAAEQGQAPSKPASAHTPLEVLERLKYLNASYERRYPGLVYITFVNGRTRAQIRDEMEEKLRGVLGGKENNMDIDEIQPLPVEGHDWRNEVTRAVDDVGKIAKGRLEKLGVV